MINASDGVEMLPWNVADKIETVDAVGQARSKMASDGEEFWWECVATRLYVRGA